ncbi:aflatoxin efflux pump aflt [Fusarium longipes]|uniref:Aflatoxin efflux pump aflt n=1 Tax=Fusarium longipes TaxID=694270 RepID=A0A395RXW1_9HYPO|nr:aflatoxin efflux pump aflt [Fusarium longipes]
MSSPDKTDTGLPERKSITSLSSAEQYRPGSSTQGGCLESAQDTLPRHQQSPNASEDEVTNQDPAFDQEAFENYKPKTLKFWLIIISVFSAMLLVALDRTIIATAIPQITNDFQSLGDIGWYGSAYMLTTAAFQLIFGRIYRFYDLRKTFLACIFTFEVGSAVCGAAPSSVAFIIGRAIAGIGAAGIMTAMFGMVFGVSSVAGPLIGGAFTQHATWRWCFYMNLPVGAVASIFLFFFHTLSEKKRESVPALEHITRLDPLGTFFFVPSMVCLILALQWGGSTYAWSSWRLILLFVLFGLTLVAFAIVQIKMPKTATIPVKVITQRTMLACAGISLLVGGSMMVVIYYLPLWFQATKDVSPVDSGVYTIPLVLSLVVASIMSAAFTQRIGYYVPSMIICPCIMSIGQGLLTTLKPDIGSSHWIAYQFLVGFGLGLGMQSSGLAIQATLPKEEVPTGLSITFFCQQLGGAIFVSVGQTVLNGRLVKRLSDIPGLDSKTLVETGATELKKMVPSQFVSQVTDAYNYAITRIFYIGVALALGQLICALCVEWRSIKPKKAESSPETGDALQEKKVEES